METYNGHPSLRHWFAVNTAANTEYLYNVIHLLCLEQWLDVVREYYGHSVPADIWSYAYNEVREADNA